MVNSEFPLPTIRVLVIAGFDDSFNAVEVSVKLLVNSPNLQAGNTLVSYPAKYRENAIKTRVENVQISDDFGHSLPVTVSMMESGLLEERHLGT